MKKIKLTFEAACKIMGEDPTKLPDVSWMPEIRGKRILADYKLDILYSATKKQLEFIPDFANGNQWKYIPYLRWVPSLGAFVYSLTDYTDTDTNLGARFCFPDTKTAQEFTELNIDLINDLMRSDD